MKFGVVKHKWSDIQFAASRIIIIINSALILIELPSRYGDLTKEGFQNL